MMLRLSRRSLLASASVFAFAGIAGRPAIAEEPRRGGTLNVHMPQEQRLLNPALRASIGIYIIGSKIVEPLIDLDADGNLAPMLATSWEGSPDGKTITLKLREGVRWHDGRPFTAADVQFTAMEIWKKYLNFASSLHAALDAVDTPDAHTVVFRYSKPMPLGLFLGAMPDLGYIAPKHVYEGTNILENPANAGPIGTGPFKFVSYERGQYIIAERNKDYWRAGLPYLDRIIWRFIPDKAAATVAIEAGQVQMSNYSALPLADLARLAKDPRFEVSSRGNERQPFQNTIEFNLRRKELSDVRVRRAIIHAIDTDFFIENFLYGSGKRARGPFPASSAFFSPGAPDYAFDVKKANALLDEAGFPKGRDGTRFQLKLLSPPFGDDVPLWSTFIQQSLQQVGIKVEIQKPDMAGFVSQIFRDWNYDLATDWHIFRSDPAISTMAWYRSGAPRGTAWSNQWGWENAAADRMIDDAALELDAVKRKARYGEIVKVLNEDVPLWMAIDREFISVTSRRVRNHHNNPRWPSSHWADVWLED